MDQYSRTKPSEVDECDFSQGMSEVECQQIEKTVSHPKGRKSKEIVKILIQYYHMYEGHWDEDHFKDLIIQTGYTKK